MCQFKGCSFENMDTFVHFAYFATFFCHHFQYASHIRCFTVVDYGFILANSWVFVTFFCIDFSILQFSFSDVDVLILYINQIVCKFSGNKHFTHWKWTKPSVTKYSQWTGEWTGLFDDDVQLNCMYSKACTYVV